MDPRLPEPDRPVAGERAGDRIDRYELLEEIGAGGMGVVWRARQTEPMTREVALKVIKLGMDTREVVRRFEAERQALARMEHPHIAKVLDGGTTASGRPYFVMELVRGEPITDHCARARLGLEERLRLFIAVCDGIQHAHQKGLIHRDIKPSNVLVEEREGRAEPKVIDFGIAKAIGADLERGTLLTQHAQILGTPDHMAPEQAEPSGLDVDTRADVYSLGVLLYELLTGTPPFDLRAVLERGFDELLRTIREVDPERPSTRVSTADGTAARHATGMGSEPRTLARGLSRDLDWIVMKALEKDRERRYDSASELAADVGRFLDREPVIAAPPSPLYRLKKLVQRRRGLVLSGAALVALLVAGSIGTGLGLWKAVRANAALDASLAEEERLRELAEENARRAREAEAEASARAVELEEVVDFQNAQLGGIDPERMGTLLRSALLGAVPEERRADLELGLAGVNFTDLARGSLEANLFDDTLAAIDERFEEQPLVRARLLDTVARTLRELGLLQAAAEPQAQALALHRELLGDEDPRTLRTLSGAATLRGRLGDFDGAATLFEELVATRRRLLGPDDPDTISAIGSLAAVDFARGEYGSVEALYREALEASRRALGADDRETLLALSNLAGFLRDMGRYDEAAPLYEEALAGHRRVLGDEDPATLGVMSSAAGFYRRLKDYERAEALFGEVLDVRRRTLGDEHPETLDARSLLAAVLYDAGAHQQALTIQTEVLEVRRRVLGPEHTETVTSLGNLAVSLIGLGRLEEAEPLLLENVAVRRRILGNGHSETVSSLNNLGALYVKQGRHVEAEGLLREALLGRWNIYGRGHSRAAGTLAWLKRALNARAAEAQAAGDSLAVATIEARLGAFELAGGELEAAEGDLRSADARFTEALPESDARLWHARCDLGAALGAAGPSDEARALLEAAAAWLLANTRASDPRPDAPLDEESHADALVRLVELFEDWHDADPDAGHGERADAWRARLEAWRG